MYFMIIHEVGQRADIVFTTHDGLTLSEFLFYFSLSFFLHIIPSMAFQ